MLHRIVVINSQVYTKAEVVLGNLESIQLTGENNVGKSSLIHVLNFLYLMDGQQMRFEGDRDLKESLPHYFPDTQRSFVLFEIHPLISCPILGKLLCLTGA